MCELTPFIWQGSLCLHGVRAPAPPAAAVADYYLSSTTRRPARSWPGSREGYGLASLIVHEDTIYVFASRWTDGNWNDVTHVPVRGPEELGAKVVIKGENEGIFNTSVCKGPDGFVMAYESNDPAYPPFTIKFARSADLRDTGRSCRTPPSAPNRYAACPCIRYADGTTT